MYWNLVFYNSVAWEKMTGNVIFPPTDQRECPDQYLQKYAAATSGRSILIQVEKKKTEQRERSSKNIQLEEILIWKAEARRNLQLHNRLHNCNEYPQAVLPYSEGFAFHLIRAGAERSDVPCSFWKMTGKTLCNQEVFRISIDFQFSWFICSLSERLMLVCSKLYVEFALIRCLCNRH